MLDANHVVAEENPVGCATRYPGKCGTTHDQGDEAVPEAEDDMPSRRQN
jgi:hypothetical protein